MSGYASTRDFATGLAGSNALEYFVETILNRRGTCTLVKVVSVSRSLVNVKPLVPQVDGDGNTIPHTTVFSLPFVRMGGAAAAFICDPQPGDLGVMVVCHHDITGAVKAKGESPPQTARRGNYSDGIYISLALQTSAPSNFVRINSDGTVTVQSPTVAVSHDLTVGSGASGTFISKDNRTVTVSHGIVTGIV